ncbi:pseudouridine synthase, RluD [Planoprotostelium fungivorum]|uniref:Pseudouridine synthase, RluD n=1 Tax=Planoprotostelium fungivorum TaxID=1890364 RepID=A0A2P6NLQ4_9EUKA|nr:pseudouridine synthase, RluD [Planoprotostelium fungivorum]
MRFKARRLEQLIRSACLEGFVYPFLSDHRLSSINLNRVCAPKSIFRRPIGQSVEPIESKPKFKTEIISEDEDGMRLDRWIRKKVPSVTQSIKMEDGSSEASSRIVGGQKIILPQSLWNPVYAKPGDKVDVLDPQIMDKTRELVIYQDKDVIAINKPSGLAVQGGTNITMSVDTLLPYLQYSNPEPPRLVHRLDKDTSGVLLLGRTRQSTIKLQKYFKSHQKIEKTYWAAVAGVPQEREGKVVVDIQKVNINGEEKMSVVDKANPESKKTITYHRTLCSNVVWSLVALFPETGRTHQLRVEANKVDYKYGYGTGDRDRDLNRQLEVTKDRLFLHARRISFPHPTTGEPTKIEANPPVHFQRLIKSFGQNVHKITDDDYPSKKQ